MESFIELKTGEIREAEGRYPSRMVLRQVKDKTYATHIKILPPGSEAYFILGRYFFDLEAAEEDFLKRDEELIATQAGS